MKDAALLFEKLSPEEMSEIRASGSVGALTQAALKALDRVGGGPGMAMATTSRHEDGTPEFVLHRGVAAALFERHE